MGYEFHITRREFWADDGSEISKSDWEAYVNSDQSLSVDEELGEDMVRFSGNSKYADPWLHWWRGEINTKWPDSGLILKMVEIASALDATVQGDDGETYSGAKDIPDGYDDSLGL